MSEEIEFTEGLFVKQPHEKAPDFVKAAISIKREELIDWLGKKDGEWINLDVKESKGGKWYASVNKFEPKKQDDSPASAPQDNNAMPDDDIPF